MEFKGIIYKATNLINNECYIGKTTFLLEKRIKEHHNRSCNLDCNNYFHNALRKYSRKNFKWEILKNNINDQLMLNLMETFMIMVHKSHISKGGYNITWGGDGNPGLKHSEESKIKMSLSQKGKKHTEEWKRNQSEAMKGEKHPMYGKHHSEETRNKRSLSLKGRKVWNKGKIGLQITWNKGIKMSDKTKRKISDSLKGRHLSLETKEKISYANKGKKLSPEHIEKLRGNQNRLGRHHTEETKRIIGIASKGRNIGRKHTDEEKRKMSLAKRKNNVR